MTLFDYMAAQPQPTTRTGKGKKARTSPLSAQLLLFDLFAEQPEATEAADAPATSASHLATQRFGIRRAKGIAVAVTVVEREHRRVNPWD